MSIDIYTLNRQSNSEKMLICFVNFVVRSIYQLNCRKSSVTFLARRQIKSICNIVSQSFVPRHWSNFVVIAVVSILIFVVVNIGVVVAITISQSLYFLQSSLWYTTNGKYVCCHERERGAQRSSRIAQRTKLCPSRRLRQSKYRINQTKCSLEKTHFIGWSPELSPQTSSYRTICVQEYSIISYWTNYYPITNLSLASTIGTAIAKLDLQAFYQR